MDRPGSPTVDWNIEDYERDTEEARADPARVAKYLQWWVTRPSRWVRMLMKDHGEQAFDDLPGALYFKADSGAHKVCRELGLLVQDHRPKVSAWQLSDAGLAFAEAHLPRAELAHDQLELFG